MVELVFSKLVGLFDILCALGKEKCVSAGSSMLAHVYFTFAFLYIKI